MMAEKNSKILPIEFISLLQEAAKSPVTHILEALMDSSVTAIRVNPLKVKSSEVIEILNSIADSFPKSLENGNKRIIEFKKVPWCSNGYILPERPIFTLDPAFHGGAYYVQEPSSMSLEIIKPLIDSISKNRSEPLAILDIAASPGGKSTHLISMKAADSIMISNEVIRSRVGPLIENIVKWGDHNVIITNNDPSDFTGLKNFFDIILADLPCSGEGMFRKMPTGDSSNIIPIALAEWSMENVTICQSRQRRIVADIWPSLSEGGILIYSTCTFNNRENDDNIIWLRDNFGAEIIDFGTFTDLDSLRDAGVRLSQAGGLQFFPGEVTGEGLYLAVLRKTEDNSMLGNNNFNHNSKKKQLEKYRHKLKIVKYNSLGGNSHSKLSKPDSFTPVHEQSLSLAYSGEFPTIELTKECALLFLSKGNFTTNCLNLTNSLEKGYYRVAYKGLGLGFVKNIGNRVNNLFPVERRIRMSIKI